MAWNLAMRAKGLAKTAVCAACCFGTVVGYIPFVVGAAIFTVGVAVTAGGDGGGAALIAAGAILASPALFAGEALAGVAQFAIGKPISIASPESINHVKAAVGFGPKKPKEQEVEQSQPKTRQEVTQNQSIQGNQSAIANPVRSSLKSRLPTTPTNPLLNSSPKHEPQSPSPSR